MKQTKQQKLIDYFISKGGKEFKIKSNKYICISFSDSFYFIGRKGAVRKNTKPVVSGSISVTEFYKIKDLK